MSGICLYCQRALGCHLLFGQDGRFDAERLVTEEKPKECPKFVEIEGAREKHVRERMYKNFGLGYLRALHELPELVMEGLRQGEKDELMYENVPNFQDPNLLWEGMTSIEREDVLRHQTDESGQVIVEIDSENVQHKLARPEYHIKAYLCDPDGPIRAEKPVAWMWNINQIVDHILKTEAEQSLIIKAKKPSATAEQQPKEESETTMAGRQVRTVRTAAAPAAKAAPAAAAPAARPAARPAAAAPAARPAAASPAAAHRAQPKAPAAAAPAVARAPAPAGATSTPAAGRVANPPTRRVATPAGAPGRSVAAARPAGAAPAAAVRPAAAAAAPAAIDTDLIEKCVFNVVNPMFEELLNLMKASQQTTVDVATILGDIAGQTGGTFQVESVDKDGNYMVREDGTFIKEAPQLWTHPSKIFAHVEGTGFNPENMHVIKTPADPPDEEGVAEDLPAEEPAAEEEVPEGEA